MADISHIVSLILAPTLAVPGTCLAPGLPGLFLQYCAFCKETGLGGALSIERGL